MHKHLTVLILMGFVLLSVNLSAAAVTREDVPYNTYTYTYNGKAVYSPHAYTPLVYISASDIGIGSLSGPRDLKIDSSGKIYISDTDNNRIVILNKDFTLFTILKDFKNQNQDDALQAPSGLCVTNQNHLYVCDQGNNRILEFDDNMKFVRSIENPREDLLPKGFMFSPGAVSVDKWGTVYAVSYNSTYGIMRFNRDGVFEAFMGAPKVTLSMSDKFWRSVYTKEQRSRTVSYVPVNFNNLIVDPDGFIYATSEDANKEGIAQVIKNRSKSGTLLPLKKFNFNSEDVLVRNGYFPPAGDVDFATTIPDNEVLKGASWASSITCLCLGDNGIYYLGDSKRNKIFAYDADGNLLYAFGGTGAQFGLFSHLNAIGYYQGSLLVLDKTQGSITKFELLPYGELLHETIALVSERKFNEAYKSWLEVLKQNQNFSLAYIGIGNSLLNMGNYKDAMKYFKLADYTAGYSKAFSFYREQIIGNYFLLIPLGLVLLILGFIKLLSIANRHNLERRVSRKPIIDHLIYAFYIIFHPFDGFWDLKHEKRGSKEAATIIAVLAIACVTFGQRFSGMVFGGGNVNVLNTVAVLSGAILLFTVSNWCLTSLSNGKGTLVDIYTVVGYSMLPLIFFSIPVALLTNILTAQESGFASSLTSISYLWVFILLFTGILTMHQYSLSQNIFSIVLTVLGMVIIIFLGFLLINLFVRIYSFTGNIITEISLRI